MGGRYMVGVSAEHRAGAGVAGGDEVDVDLELDTAPREVSVPADLAAALDAEPEARRTFGRGLLRLGRVVGVGGGDARVYASRQALLGGDPAQQVEQPMALGLGQPRAQLCFVLGGHLHQPLEQPPSVTGEVQGMGAAVGRAGPPLQQPRSFQLIDQGHHATGRELHGPAQGLLGLALGRGDVAQQYGVAGVDAQGGEAVLPQSGGVDAQLGEEEGDAGDTQVGR
jgi:hypothetical protein